MSVYENCYLKLLDAPAFWHVKNGERQQVESAAEMYRLGLMPVNVITEDDLLAIPLAGDVVYTGDEEE